MRISSSFLALLALIPTIASTTPVAQRIEENVSSPEPASISQPKATPKRDCIIRPISHSLDGDFALYASLDTSPFLYNVLSRGNTAEKVIELYITLARPFPPLFTLTNGLLNTTVGSDNAPVSGRFGPSSNGLQRLLFGGSGEPADFYSVRNCYDAEGNPNDELVAGRGISLFIFALFISLFCHHGVLFIVCLFSPLRTPSIKSIAKLGTAFLFSSSK